MIRPAVRSFFQMLHHMRRDPTLLTVTLIPLLCGLAFRFGVPAAEIQLTYFLTPDTILLPYYPLFDLLLLLFVPAMLNYVSAMIVLEEADEGLISYLVVTPLGKAGYLLSRFGLTGLISLLYGAGLYALFHLSAFSPLTLAVSVFAGTVQGMGSAMLIVICSKNKVEGMAVGKFTSLFLLAALAPFFVEGNTQYLFSLLPAFWLSKAVSEGNLLFLPAACLTAVLWAVLPVRLFTRKLF